MKEERAIRGSGGGAGLKQVGLSEVKGQELARNIALRPPADAGDRAGAGHMAPPLLVLDEPSSGLNPP